MIGSNLESDASTLAQLWIYLHASIGLLTDASANVQTLAQALRWLKLTRDLECFAKRLHKSQLIFIAYPDPWVTHCDLDEDLVISRFCFDFYGEDSELLTFRILDCIVEQIDQNLWESVPIVADLCDLGDAVDLEGRMDLICDQFFFKNLEHRAYMLFQVARRPLHLEYSLFWAITMVAFPAVTQIHGVAAE